MEITEKEQNFRTVVFLGPNLSQVNTQMNTWLRNNQGKRPTCLTVCTDGNSACVVMAVENAQVVVGLQSVNEFTITEVSEAPKPDLDKIDYSDLLIKLGFEPHFRGFRYIKNAIQMTVKDPKLLHNIVKGLYTRIGEHWGATGSQVERCIRTAIEKAYDTGKMFSLRDWNDLPTNGMFLGTITEKLLNGVDICKEEMA